MGVSTCIDRAGTCLALGDLREMSADPTLTQAPISAIVKMVPSIHVRISGIARHYGLSDADTKVLLRQSLKPPSYR